MTYFGESFSYVNSDGYLDGATCKFVNEDGEIICEGWGAAAVMTKFIIITGMEIIRPATISTSIHRKRKRADGRSQCWIS